MAIQVLNDKWRNIDRQKDKANMYDIVKRIAYANTTDYRKILGVPNDAGLRTMITAYRQDARTIHPDIVNRRTDMSEEEKKNVEEAFKVLNNANEKLTAGLQKAANAAEAEARAPENAAMAAAFKEKMEKEAYRNDRSRSASAKRKKPMPPPPHAAPKAHGRTYGLGSSLSLSSPPPTAPTGQPRTQRKATSAHNQPAPNEPATAAAGDKRRRSRSPTQTQQPPATWSRRMSDMAYMAASGTYNVAGNVAGMTARGVKRASGFAFRGAKYAGGKAYEYSGVPTALEKRRLAAAVRQHQERTKELADRRNTAVAERAEQDAKFREMSRSLSREKASIERRRTAAPAPTQAAQSTWFYAG